MLLSKLNQMSVGPLWVLRKPSAAPSATHQICPACGEPWLQSATDETAILVVLAAVATNPAEQILLQNCLRAAGWNEPASFSLHSVCFATPETAMQALQTHIAESSAQTIIVFGADAAQRINPEFNRGRVHSFFGARLVVTYRPEDMIADPSLKALVWADLCMAAHEA
jgi:hypothetical protein